MMALTGDAKTGLAVEDGLLLQVPAQHGQSVRLEAHSG